jgi:tetratricopeptide (TPR) repeat protein
MQQFNEDAYFYYKKSHRVSPKAPASLSALANLCERLGKKKEALEAFVKIIDIDSADATAMNYVGYMYAEKGESLEYALALIERALAIEPNNGYFIDSRGWVFYQMGDFDEAYADLVRAAALVEDAVIFEHLGDACVKLDRIPEARDAYDRALVLDPLNNSLKKKRGGLKQ